MSRWGISRADWLALVWLVPIAVVATCIAAIYLPEKTGDVRRQPSTFFNAPYGTKGAYLTLERLGFDVRRHRAPLAPLGDVEVLFLLRPVVELSDTERSTLLEWVAAGHTLVVSPSAEEDLDEWFRYGTRPSNDVASRPARRATRSDGLTRDPLLDGVERVETRSRARFHGLEPVRGVLGQARVLWKDDRGVVALRVPHGRGTVVALAATDFLENDHLDRADHPALLVNLASGSSPGDAGRVAFDEARLGFERRDSSSTAMAKLVALSPYRPGLIQALVVSLLALAAGAVRFGAPRQTEPVSRRRRGELVYAAAQLFRRAHARAFVHEKLLWHYRRRLCQLTHLDPACLDDELVAALRQRTGVSTADLQERIAPPIGRDLAGSTRRLFHLIESLRHGIR